MSFRDDGDALLARNAALAAENARLRAENERLQAPPTALVASPREARTVAAPRSTWKRYGAAAALWIAAIAVAIAQGLIPL